MITGTIRSAVQLQVLENKWQQKKNNINANKPEKEMTHEERLMASFQEQVDKERESNSHADIYNKLKSGGKLTSQEVSYLEEHDPEALRKYREDQAEKAAYEREIKNCRTKDDVERVKMNKLGNMAAQAKKITNDPYIPLDKKVELMNQMNNKLCLVREAHQKFVESKQYQDMPTDGELQEERTDEALESMNEMQAMAQGSEEAEIEVTESEENFLDTSFEEDAEDKMEKAAREKKDEFQPKEIVESREDVSFEKVTSDIKNFLVSSGEGRGKFDVSV